MQGKVKFFLKDKGYGFISAEDNKDYFFHFTDTLDKVGQDEEVVFDLESGKKGTKAINVKRKK